VEPIWLANQFKFHFRRAAINSSCEHYLFLHLQLRETPNKKAIIRALPIQTVFLRVKEWGGQGSDLAPIQLSAAAVLSFERAARVCVFVMKRAARGIKWSIREDYPQVAALLSFPSYGTHAASLPYL
jgi:hypothetical protein